jgi:hypothetical protein
MLTDSETNTSQFTTTSVFASSESVGTVYTKPQGLSRTYPPVTVSSDDLGLSSSDENRTSWKNVTKDTVYYNSDSVLPTVSYRNGVSFNGTNDKVKYVLHGTCLKENACTGIPFLSEYAETTPSQTGFSFSNASTFTDCYRVSCADGYTSDASAGTGTALTYTGASGTTYKCYPSECKTDAEYFHVGVLTQTESSGNNRMIPTWNIGANTTLESVDGHECDDNSVINISSIYLNRYYCRSTGLQTTLASLGIYNTDTYYVKSGSLYSANGSAVESKTVVCTGSTSGIYLSGVDYTHAPVVSVCGASLTVGQSYTFKFKDSGCEYTKSLEVVGIQ